MERSAAGSIFRAAFDARVHGLTLGQHKAGRALMACRTEALLRDLAKQRWRIEGQYAQGEGVASAPGKTMKLRASFM